MKFFKNRLPQGSINNPFNIESAADNYKTTKSFFLQSLILSPLK